MHYYQFNLSDYITATAHLTPMQDLAYRRLLDYYYEKEKPIPNKTEWVSNRIRLASERESVEHVLSEYFALNDADEWVHDVCEANIKAYQKRCVTNKANSIKGGRPKKTESVSSRIPNQELITNNQEPITKDQKKGGKRFSPPSVIEVRQYCDERKNKVDPETFVDFYESKGWIVGKNKMKSWKACVRTWEKRNNNEGSNNGTHKQTSKPSLGERATNARKKYEQQIDAESLGAVKPHLRT